MIETLTDVYWKDNSSNHVRRSSVGKALRAPPTNSSPGGDTAPPRFLR